MVVAVSNVTLRKRGKLLLDDVTLDLSGPGVTAIIGPNGAGKSTLLRLLHGLERPRSGQVHCDVDPRAQSFLFQTPILLRRSVLGNLMLPLALRGVAKAQAKSCATTIAAQFELGALLTTDAYLLSGGEKQKLALARALITDPEILFLDEPSANLDRPSTQLIEAAVAARVAAGTKVFLASHSMAQVRRLAHDVVFVAGPQVYGPYSVQDFFDTPPLDAVKNWLEDI